MKYLPLLWILVLSLITFKLSEPIPVRPAEAEGFSAVNAMEHLSVMASEIHFLGTKENRKVKQYILDEFARLDIPTELFTAHSQRVWGNTYRRIGRTENIIATIKGKSNGKAVMVVGHYDSVLGSPGAADDVHAVACMLEIAKELKKEEHENDIIFLITDGEELGLFGAKAFSEQRNVDNIGVVLNYEARGNSGASISFEWSEGNAWLVNQLKKVATRPVANSMSFEIYKNLPNDTDFTFFKKAGLNGINHAFIDGFSYYHNPADTPEAINKNSVQHTGTNMLALTKHFANTDLSVTKTHNATFFNFLGLLIIYPSSIDIFILILSLIFIGFVLFTSYKSGQWNIKSFAFSFGMILLSVIVSAALSYGLGKAAMSVYPQYESFYAGQFYNHKWYLVTVIGICILIAALCAKVVKLKENYKSFNAAALLFLGILSIVFYLVIPTATYFMLYPSISLALYFFFSTKEREDKSNKFLAYGASLIPLVMWLPTIVLFFLAFSLEGLPMPAIHVSIIAVSTMVLFREIWTPSSLLSYSGMAVIIASLLMAHLTSSPTKEHPLPSSLFYHYNVTSGQAKLGNDDRHINIGNEEFLKGAERTEMRMPYIGTFWNVATDIKPHVAIPQIIRDSLDGNVIKIVSNEEVYNTSFRIEKPSNIKSLYLNGQEVFVDRETDARMTIESFGMNVDTMTLRIIRRNSSGKQAISIGSHFMSLPFEDRVPENALRSEAYTVIVQDVEM